MLRAHRKLIYPKFGNVSAWLPLTTGQHFPNNPCVRSGQTLKIVLQFPQMARSAVACNHRICSSSVLRFRPTNEAVATAFAPGSQTGRHVGLLAAFSLDISEHSCSAGRFVELQLLWWRRSAAQLFPGHYQIIPHSDCHGSPVCSQMLDLNICHNATLLTMKISSRGMKLIFFFPSPEPQFDIHLARHRNPFCSSTF